MNHSYFSLAPQNEYAFACACGELIELETDKAILQCINDYQVDEIILPIANTATNPAAAKKLRQNIDKLKSYSVFVYGKGNLSDKTIYPKDIYDSPLITGKTIVSISTDKNTPSYIYASPDDIAFSTSKKSSNIRMITIEIPEQKVVLPDLKHPGKKEEVPVNKIIAIMDNYDPNALPLFIQRPFSAVKRIPNETKFITTNAVSIKVIQIGAQSMNY